MARLELEDSLAGRLTRPLPAIERRGRRFHRVMAGALVGLLVGMAGRA
jgi:hypothetical protein